MTSSLQVIHRDHDSAIYAISTHPFKPHLATASYSGLIKVWDYETKTTLASRKFDHHLKVRTLQYDPRGEFMGKVHMCSHLKYPKVHVDRSTMCVYL